MIFSPLTTIRVQVTVILKEPFPEWWSNYEGHLEVHGLAAAHHCYAEQGVTVNELVQIFTCMSLS
jgi:hypothetical protein